MTSNLSNLHAKKPREKSGPRTGARFEFQANFSIIKIIDLHKGGNDYRVLLDHFDDLAILNSSSDEPTEIRFYQIKGRDAAKHWTIKQLTKNETLAPPKSILGKMYKNAFDFPTETKLIVFASNAAFNVLLNDGTKSTADHKLIYGSELHESEIKIAEAALEPDFPSPRNPTCASALLLERTDLPVQGHATFVRGRLVEFLEETSSSDGVRLTGLYEVLFNNIMKRANNTEQPTTLKVFHESKSISRLEITEIFERATAKRSFETMWPTIESDLRLVDYETMQILRIKNGALRYMRELARGDISPNEFSADIRNAATQKKSALAKCTSLVAITKLLSAGAPPLATYSDDEIIGALLFEALEAAA